MLAKKYASIGKARLAFEHELTSIVLSFDLIMNTFCRHFCCCGFVSSIRHPPINTNRSGRTYEYRLRTDYLVQTTDKYSGNDWYDTT